MTKTTSRALAVLLALLCLASVAPAAARGGMVVKESRHGVGETLDRLESALKEKGVTVFARIDHAAGAARVGMDLRPTQLLVFGNPKMGTPLMQSRRTIGLDLPLKALAYEDADGRVLLVYNRPDYLAGRHGIAGRDEILAKMEKVLDSFTDAATR